jgi:hypothetical protein
MRGYEKLSPRSQRRRDEGFTWSRKHALIKDDGFGLCIELHHDKHIGEKHISNKNWTFLKDEIELFEKHDNDNQTTLL